MDLSHVPIAKIWFSNCVDKVLSTRVTTIGATSKVGIIALGTTTSSITGISTPGAMNVLIAIKHFVTLIAKTPGANS